jgi:hypothetical protein
MKQSLTLQNYSPGKIKKGKKDKIMEPDDRMIVSVYQSPFTMHVAVSR